MRDRVASFDVDTLEAGTYALAYPVISEGGDSNDRSPHGPGTKMQREDGGATKEPYEDPLRRKTTHEQRASDQPCVRIRTKGFEGKSTLT